MVTPKVILHRVRRRLKGLVARLTEPDPFSMEPQSEEPSVRQWRGHMLYHYINMVGRKCRCGFDHDPCPDVKQGCGNRCARYLPSAECEGGLESQALIYASRLSKLKGLIRDLEKHQNGGFQHQYRKGLERAYDVVTGND